MSRMVSMPCSVMTAKYHPVTTEADDKLERCHFTLEYLYLGNFGDQVDKNCVQVRRPEQVFLSLVFHTDEYDILRQHTRLDVTMADQNSPKRSYSFSNLNGSDAESSFDADYRCCIGLLLNQAG